MCRRPHARRVAAWPCRAGPASTGASGGCTLPANWPRTSATTAWNGVGCCAARVRAPWTSRPKAGPHCSPGWACRSGVTQRCSNAHAWVSEGLLGHVTVRDAPAAARFAAGFGSKRVAIHAGHGIFTNGHSIDEAACWFVLMNRCCEAQLLAQACTTPNLQPTLWAAEDARWLASVPGAASFGGLSFGGLSFQTLWEEIIASDPDLVDPQRAARQLSTPTPAPYCGAGRWRRRSGSCPPACRPAMARRPGWPPGGSPAAGCRTCGPWPRAACAYRG